MGKSWKEKPDKWKKNKDFQKKQKQKQKHKNRPRPLDDVDKDLMHEFEIERW